MRKAMKGVDITLDLARLCPALSLQQIYKLTEHQHDDWIMGEAHGGAWAESLLESVPESMLESGKEECRCTGSQRMHCCARQPMRCCEMQHMQCACGAVVALCQPCLANPRLQVAVVRQAAVVQALWALVQVGCPFMAGACCLSSPSLPCPLPPPLPPCLSACRLLLRWHTEHRAAGDPAAADGRAASAGGRRG